MTALLIATALALGIVYFYDSNPEIVHIDLLIEKISVPLASALLGAGFLGALAGGALVFMLKQRLPEKEVNEKRK